MKHEYRIRPVSDFYVVECRPVYSELHKGEWTRCEPLSLFGKYSSICSTEWGARRLVAKHKRQQEKWERDYERRKKIEKSRKVIHIE